MPRTQLRKGEQTPPSRRTWDKGKMVEVVKKAANIFELPITTLRRFARQMETSPEDLVEQKHGRKTVFQIIWRQN
ncbi:hypothetical protein PR048_027984 [Dryococelus australis]|uniref:HTH psq-type domain-containing protein n=1 Tax=Dryococelus australis TaxID=614101 RepID=A0ABQ9GHZ2_9NEOP|nr:hypothetical protein PR048_027984 [Dryococelus australis]